MPGFSHAHPSFSFGVQSPENSIFGILFLSARKKCANCNSALWTNCSDYGCLVLKAAILPDGPWRYLALSYKAPNSSAATVIPFTTPSVPSCLLQPPQDPESSTSFFVIRSSPNHLSKTKASETNHTVCFRLTHLKVFNPTQPTAGHSPRDSWQCSNILHVDLPAVISPHPLHPHALNWSPT